MWCTSPLFGCYITEHSITYQSSFLENYLWARDDGEGWLALKTHWLMTWRLCQFSFICCEHSRVKNLCSCFIHIVFDWKHKFILHSLWLKTQVHIALQLVSLHMLWVASYSQVDEQLFYQLCCMLIAKLVVLCFFGDHHPKPWAEKERKSLHSDFSQRHRQLCLILIKDTTSLCKWFV